MGFRKVFLLLLIAGLFFSCSNNFLPVNLVTDTDIEPAIGYDSTREIAVFIDENNDVIDIESFDEENEKSVKCINPIDMAIFNNNTSARFSGKENKIRAIVIGIREDDKPGVWLIFRDGSVQSPYSESTGRRSSFLKDADNHDENRIGGEIEGFLGWTYHPTLISDDGLMIGGYALNEDGFSKYFFNIEPGAQAAVYWRLKETPNGFYMISRAKVIGTLIESAEEQGRFYGWWQHIVSRLKILFLNYLDDYLTEPYSIKNKDNSSLYFIAGPNKNGEQAVASVDFNHVYSIEIETSGNNPPVASFADADYIVLNGGLAEANGLYVENGTSGSPVYNGVKYDKISGADYFLYQFSPDGNNLYWTIHSSVVQEITIVENVIYYSSLTAVSDPPDSYWTSSYIPDPAPVPEVHTYPLYVEGSGPSYTISANYEYSDPDNDIEGNTKYTWYSSADGVSGWTLEEDGTSQSIVRSDIGFLKVVITPVDNNGNEGTSLESDPIDIGNS